MKILATGLYPMWHFHFSIELEIIQNHLDAGDDVALITCAADLEACEPNPEHLLSHCARCVGIRQHGVSLLSGPIRELRLFNSESIPIGPLKTKFASLDELKAYTIDDYDVGMAAFSSLVTLVKSVEPCLKTHADLVARSIRSSWRLYQYAMNVLERESPDLVYLFNGRFATTRPWFRAGQKRSQQFIVHERAGLLDRHREHMNTIPHEPTQHRALIQKHWIAATGEELALRDQKARELFIDARGGSDGSWHSFIKNQQQGKLPDDFDPTKRNLVAFASTENEMVGLAGIYDRRLFQSQLDGIHRVCEIFAADPVTFIYLRIHPNSHSEAIKWWYDPRLKEFKNLIVIEPTADISSYALLDQAWKVISFGSTIGIEAAYWGKPSVLLGEAAYRGIGAVYEPEDQDDVTKILSQPTLSPLDQTPCLKYGYYTKYSGIQWKHLKVQNYYTLAFKGQILEARQEVHEWLGECEARPSVSGFKKWLQDRDDRRKFKNSGSNVMVGLQDPAFPNPNLDHEYQLNSYSSTGFQPTGLCCAVGGVIAGT